MLVVVFVSCFWPIAYDVMYAMADCNDDKHLGIGSLALWLGHYAPIVVLLCHLFLVIGLVHIGHLSGANDWFFGGLMLASLCVYRQMFYLKAGSSRSYIKAFKNNQWYGGLIWLCFCIAWLKI